MSSGFNIYPKSKPIVVNFSAGSDNDMEDEGLNPPLVRERWTDQANLFLDADNVNQLNPKANTAQWIIGDTVNSAKGTGGFFSSRVKKFSPSYILLSLYAPNINPRNNILEFEVNGQQWRATIPINNYTRLTTDYNNVPATTPATYNVSGPTWAPLPAELRGDPADGIIDHILTAMNTARNIATNALYDPTAVGYGQFKAVFSNGYATGSTFNSDRYRNTGTGENLLTRDAKYGGIECFNTTSGGNVLFRMTGGNTFNRGLRAWGCSRIPVGGTPTYVRYIFGPVQLQYSRWVDIIMPELMQFSKISNAGTSVPAGLFARLYTTRTVNGLFDVVLDGLRQPQINMRKDYSINYLTIELRDEYGELFEIPDISKNPVNNDDTWPNTQGVDISLSCQL